MKKKLNANLAILFLIMLVAFIVRATYNRLDYMSEGTPADYGYEASQIAASVATGHGFGNPYPLIQTGPTALMPPGYIYLLAGIYKAFGVHTTSAYLVATTLTGFFSTLICIPIFLIGRRVDGPPLGLAAAGLWAVLPTAVMFTTGAVSGVWDTALSTLFAALILLATIRIRDSEKTGDWIGYGLLCALALQVNPSILSVLPLLFVWLAWRQYPERRKWLRLPALAGLVIVLGCAPWAARNWVTFHRFIPFRSNFGLELWLGNNLYEDHDLFPDTRSPYSSWIETRRLAQIGEVAFMQEKKAEAIRYIETHRLKTLYSVYMRFVVIWTGTSVRVKDVWPMMDWGKRISLMANAVFVIIGWAGLWVMFRRRHTLAWPFLIYLVFYPAVYYVTHANLRYRSPVDPALAVLSAYAVFCAASALLRRFAGTSTQPVSTAEPQFH
ncbi:MAG: glycosyltransferase family 39 protein [Candidatus Acidiferrales bacterium]